MIGGILVSKQIYKFPAWLDGGAGWNKVDGKLRFGYVNYDDLESLAYIGWVKL